MSMEIPRWRLVAVGFVVLVLALSGFAGPANADEGLLAPAERCVTLEDGSTTCEVLLPECAPGPDGNGDESVPPGCYYEFSPNPSGCALFVDENGDESVPPTCVDDFRRGLSG